MPITISLLQDVGLNDWPSWYRELNPGYFVSEIMVAARQNRGGNRRMRGGMSSQHVHGATCCPNHGGMNAGPVYGGKAERLRTGNRVVVKERATGRVMKSEELGEQIIARLRNMEKEANAKAKAEKEREKISGNAVIERTQARDARRWEDESESDGAAEERDRGENAAEVAVPMKLGGKLVEV